MTENTNLTPLGAWAVRKVEEGINPVDLICDMAAVCTHLLQLESGTDPEAGPLRKGAERMQQLDRVYDAAKLLSKLSSDEYDRLRLKTLPEMMIEDDVKTITFDGIGRVQLGADCYASIPADMREDAYKWLRENNAGSLITETVNSSTLKSWAKEKLESGVELPECFKVTPYSRVSIVKARGKK